MILVDTSALMAIVLDETSADACGEALMAADGVLVSAATVGEALIVARGRHVGDEMARLIEGFGFEFVELSAEGARRTAESHLRWGKGNHPAPLNFGDCFAYALAEERGCPLLFVGNDFGRTEVRPARAN